MAEVSAVGKECDNETNEAVFDETDDEEDAAEAAPRRNDHEVHMSTGAAGSVEE